jgi:hypothetical protein
MLKVERERERERESDSCESTFLSEMESDDKEKTFGSVYNSLLIGIQFSFPFRKRREAKRIRKHAAFNSEMTETCYERATRIDST